ncbi:MAG: hypothetical protein AAFU69_10035 [Pseudomonadota bacterium]
MINKIKQFTATSLVLLLASPLAAGPLAEVICSPTELLHTRLTKQYGSEKQSSGLRGPDQMMEIWTNESGDWTLVIRYATGNSCIVAMGEAWETRSRDPA